MARVTWQFSGSSFYRHSGEEFAPRFDAKVGYTKDTVLGATSAAQSYLDIGATEVGPLTLRCEFETEAARQTFQALIGTTGTLSNTAGLSYTATLLKVTRIEGGGGSIYRADTTWEQR